MLKSFYVVMLSLVTSLLHCAGAPVYIVGARINTINSTNIATLWITDTSGKSPKTVELGKQELSSFATSIKALNNKLYCLGLELDQSYGTAILWITDTSGSSLQAVNLDNFTIPEAAGGQITSVGNKIFCSGFLPSDSNKAALLVFDTSNQRQSIIRLGTDNSKSTGVAVTYANNKIYCLGNGNAGDTYSAQLWITNTSGELLHTIQLASREDIIRATALTAANNKIYCVGKVMETPTLWITDIDGTILKTTQI